MDWEQEYSNYIKKGVSVFASYVKAWYTGHLQTIFFEGNDNPEIKRQICSVLAGYVWDENNPFVKSHDRLITTVAKIIAMENERPDRKTALIATVKKPANGVRFRFGKNL